MLEEEFQKLAKLQGWKPCPKCKAMVEKTQGCNHMECICGVNWCYRCGNANYYSRQHQSTCAA